MGYKPRCPAEFAGHLGLFYVANNVPHKAWPNALYEINNSRVSGDNRAADIIKNWLRNRYTIEFLGTWEIIHNPNFKVVEFDHFRMSAGLPSFVLSATEWIERTNAIGLDVKRGRYGGTYAHKDIAFEFGSAISVPFKLYLIEEFQRLKNEEQKLIGWSAKRELSKINYRIHTDAIKTHLLPVEITRDQASRCPTYVISREIQRSAECS